MTRRKYIRWGATAAVTVGIAVLAIRQSVPKIAGKPITTLLVEMNETEPEVAAKAQGILRTSGTKAVPALIGALDLRNSRYRNSYNLFRTKLPFFLQPFIPELEDKSAYRLYSANALATLGASAKPAIPKLKELLRDENDMVRCAGARTLGSIGRDAVCVAPELVTLLKSTNVHVRLAAALALWKIDTVTCGSAATQGFVAALQGDYAAKADAISCLGEISKMQLAVRPLMEQLNPENHYRKPD